MPKGWHTDVILGTLRYSYADISSHSLGASGILTAFIRLEVLSGEFGKRTMFLHDCRFYEGAGTGDVVTVLVSQTELPLLRNRTFSFSAPSSVIGYLIVLNEKGSQLISVGYNLGIKSKENTKFVFFDTRADYSKL
eukprot:IDg19455t1